MVTRVETTIAVKETRRWILAAGRGFPELGGKILGKDANTKIKERKGRRRRVLKEERRSEERCVIKENLR